MAVSFISGGNPEKTTDLSQVTDKPYHINVVSSTPRPSGIRTHNDCIGGAMVSMLASSAVDHGFEARSGQTKDYKIGICCFSAKQAALRRKSEDWLARNQNNVSECSDMSTRGLLHQ